MSGLKRKASQELSRSSTAVVEPDTLPASFMKNYLPGTLSFSWLRGIYNSWIGHTTSNSLIMPQTSDEITAEAYKDNFEQRINGTTSFKRQMIRRTKSAKTIYTPNRAGRGMVDYNGCQTDDDYARRNDDFWAPPDLGMLGLDKTSKVELLRTPEDSEDEDSIKKQEVIIRRHSHEILSPRTPQSMSPTAPPRHGAQPRLPRSPESRSRSIQSPDEVDDGDIMRRLEGLLVTTEENRQRSGLVISCRQREILDRKAKENAAKARAAALRAAKERRLYRRYPSKPLIQALNESWESKVRAAKTERNPTKVLVNASKGTELTAKDFATLLGRCTWLNDEIVNAYLECIEDAANKAAIAEAKASCEPVTNVPKFLAHNSFFFDTLRERGPGQTDRLMRRRKAHGKSLLEVDTMFVPICKGNHWTIGVVRPVARTIEYFDSFGGSGTLFDQVMRGFLKFQLKDAYIEAEWTTPKTTCAQQNNSYDCGVFMCTNAFCVAFGLDTSSYTEADMTQQRRNIAAILLNEGFHGEFDWETCGY